LVVLESCSRILTELHPNELPVVSMVLRVAAYHQHWLRLPEDWKPVIHETAREQWSSLLRHLFERYPVPKCLEAAWLARGTLEHFERDCYCAAGAGHSVRSVMGFPPSVSHRTLHIALSECDEPSIAMAVWRAQLKVLAAGERLQREVMESRVVRDLSNHARWLRIVARFVHASEGAQDFGLVVDALAMVTAQEGQLRCEQLLRLPLHELRSWCRRWWQNLLKNNHELFAASQLHDPSTREALRQISSMIWSPLLNERWYMKESNGAQPTREWEMVELCSQSALIAEGHELRHCVASYGGRCRAGHTAVFSLRCRDLKCQPIFEERLVTVQVATKVRQVVQIRGYRNRMPDESAMAMVRDWAQSHGLRVSAIALR
jgi:hypothetical protein